MLSMSFVLFSSIVFAQSNLVDTISNLFCNQLYSNVEMYKSTIVRNNILENLQKLTYENIDLFGKFEDEIRNEYPNYKTQQIYLLKIKRICESLIENCPNFVKLYSPSSSQIIETQSLKFIKCDLDFYIQSKGDEITFELVLEQMFKLMKKYRYQIQEDYNQEIITPRILSAYLMENSKQYQRLFIIDQLELLYNQKF